MNIKKCVGEASANYVKDGMVIGLGTGTTMFYAIQSIGARVKNEGLKIKAVATSKKTEQLAKEFGIECIDFSTVDQLDLTIDGADAIDPKLNAIKGGGGALFREKIVALNSKRFIIIADDSKLVNTFDAVKIPIEIIPFGFHTTIHYIKTYFKEANLRFSLDHPYLTDNGNYIVDCLQPLTANQKTLDLQVKRITGVVETGLFLNIAELVLICDEKGNIREFTQG